MTWKAERNTTVRGEINLIRLGHENVVFGRFRDIELANCVADLLNGKYPEDDINDIINMHVEDALAENPSPEIMAKQMAADIFEARNQEGPYDAWTE